jgi:L-ribulose-5-phosphate 4-epimerase
MLEELKEKVYKANLEMVNKNVVIYTWGNVSEIDRKSGLVVIKPSGVDYSTMKPEDLVVVELATGKTVEGKYKPSSDTPTHLELYRSFKEIGGICHTHSTNAVAFAQAGKSIIALGTTHADDFLGNILCTRDLTEEEVNNNYELNTGKVIRETINNANYRIMDCPGILVKNHGPFTWGVDANKAVYNSVVMEKVAEMALKTILLNPENNMPDYILNKHFQRKHGKNAYYGQNK